MLAFELSECSVLLHINVSFFSKALRTSAGDSGVVSAVRLPCFCPHFISTWPVATNEWDRHQSSAEDPGPSVRKTAIHTVTILTLTCISGKGWSHQSWEVFVFIKLTKPKKKPTSVSGNQWNNSFDICHSSLSKKRRPMGKLVYNLLSIAELKRRLKECHLSAQGSREQLIKRHQNFVQIYNAECDALNPKSGNTQTLLCFSETFL